MLRWVLASVVFLAGCDVVRGIVDSAEEAQNEFMEGFHEGLNEGRAESEPAPSAPDGSTQGFASGYYRREPVATQSVELFDQGIGMVRSTVTPPAGWQVYHDIDTDPQTLESRRYILDYIGPQGQLIRGISAGKYWAIKNQRFTPSWQSAVRGALPGVENLRFSETSHSPRLAASPTAQRFGQMMKLEPLEAQLTATHDGKAVEGTVYLFHFPLGRDIGGTFSASVTLAPAGMGDAMAEIVSHLWRTEVINPAFDRRMAELTNQLSARSAQQHQARMRRNQANFEAHQARMRAQSQTFDAANKAWLDNFRGSGSGYTGHEQFVDAIHERNSFADPNTGRAHNDVYKFNFTDGQGNFYGTDDPSFDPASLQGDWQVAPVLSPQ